MLPFSGNINFTEAIQKLLAGEELELKYPALLDSRFHFISGFLFRLLSELDISYLSELVLVLLKEITSNCSKANAKRIFFDENKIDPSDKTAYEKLMTRFSDEVLSDWDTFTASHSKSRYFISVKLKVTKEELLIVVENNVKILPWEWNRINARFESFKKYQDLNQAFNEIRDSSEGAGLGIVLTLVLLFNAGIPPGNFTLQSDDTATFTTLKIPLKVVPPAAKEKFTNLILSEINSLPSFPENIAYLINLCSSDTASVQAIADHIQRDPALTAQILRLVNSAGYMSRIRNPSLLDSVKIIGLKVIRNLLMVSGARNVMNSKYKHRGLEQIWEESNRVSFFARRLCKTKPAIIEQATVAGLLFELGRIVLLSINPDLLKNIDEFMANGRIRSASVIEEIAVGMSHAEIGALLAERWHFPEPLVMAIRYQDKPLQAVAEYEELIQCIYLATRIQAASHQKGNYFSCELEILQAFGIQSESAFADFVKSLDEEYKSSIPAV